MRIIIVLLLFVFLASAEAKSQHISGKIHSLKECSPKVMVWLSLDEEDYHKRLLLMHTLVPVGGTFQFYVKPGRYQVRATDEKECEFMQKVDVSKTSLELKVKMVKK